MKKFPIFVTTLALAAGLLLANPISLEAVKIDTSNEEAELCKALETLGQADYFKSKYNKLACKMICGSTKDKDAEICLQKCEIEHLKRVIELLKASNDSK